MKKLWQKLPPDTTVAALVLVREGKRCEELRLKHQNQNSLRDRFAQLNIEESWVNHEITSHGRHPPFVSQSTSTSTLDSTAASHI